MENGYDTQALKAKARRHLWMAYQPPEPFGPDGGPPILVAAEGTWMVDSDGKRFLDGVSALEACIAGHIRPELADRISRWELATVRRFSYASTRHRLQDLP